MKEILEKRLEADGPRRWFAGVIEEDEIFSPGNGFEFRSIIRSVASFPTMPSASDPKERVMHRDNHSHSHGNRASKWCGVEGKLVIT